MKYKLLFIIVFLSVTATVSAQKSWKEIFKSVIVTDTAAAKKTSDTNSTSSSISTILGSILGSTKKDSAVTTSDVVSGLKEALSQGVNKGTTKLSATDGFFKDAALKILLPQEAQNVEKTLRNIGLGKQVDNAVLSMNRAAEDATKSAAPIFLNAIKSMSIQDAWGILRGNEIAATSYLKTKTTSPLTEAFRPVIENSLKKVNATKYWSTLMTSYNAVSKNKINPDLSAYVTERAMSGIFMQIAEQEKSIRKDPLGQTSDLLKKVFSAK